MPVDEIPADVLTLVRERVSGLDDLEMLLLVRGDPVRAWTPSCAAARLGVPEARGAEALQALHAAALLAMDERATARRFFYRPATPALESAVNALARLCSVRPADVIRMLNEHALERVRAAARRAFPEAFAVQRAG
jgi:hypothetical protein